MVPFKFCIELHHFWRTLKGICGWLVAWIASIAFDALHVCCWKRIKWGSILGKDFQWICESSSGQHKSHLVLLFHFPSSLHLPGGTFVHDMIMMLRFLSLCLAYKYDLPAWVYNTQEIYVKQMQNAVHTSLNCTAKSLQIKAVSYLRNNMSSAKLIYYTICIEYVHYNNFIQDKSR